MNYFRNRMPVYNYRWSGDYSPGSPFVSYMNMNRSPYGFGQPQNGGGGQPPGGGGGGTTNPPGGGTGQRPPYQWTPPNLMNPPFGLGADWRATMRQYVYPNQ